MNTRSRLYDESLYDGIARDVCLHAVEKCDTLLQIFTDPVLSRKHGIDPMRVRDRIPRLEALRAEWQEAADRAPEIGTWLSEEEIRLMRQRLNIEP